MDPVAVEVHDVDVVGRGAFPGRWYGPALSRVCSAEDAERRDVVARLVDRERPHLGVAVRQRYQQTLHPLGVGLQRFYPVQRVDLRGERRAWVAILRAPVPALPRLARVEELLCDVPDRGHGSPLCLRGLSAYGRPREGD